LLRAPERIVVGKIVSTQGLHGEMRVQPFTDFPERFAEIPELLAQHPSGREITLHPRNSRMQKNVVILSCREWKAVDDVRPWIDSVLTISSTDAQPLPEGVFYVFQILGLDVYTEENFHLGSVVDVLSPGAHDIYVVRLTPKALELRVDLRENELLVPVVDEFILQTDLENGRIVVRLLPGML